MSIGYLMQLQRYVILQLRDPFPDERRADTRRRLRLIARELERLMFA